MTSGHLLCCKGQATMLQLPSSHRWQTATLVGSCFSRHLPLARASHLPVLHVKISARDVTLCAQSKTDSRLSSAQLRSSARYHTEVLVAHWQKTRHWWCPCPC